jgi:hypothetical protein
VSTGAGRAVVLRHLECAVSTVGERSQKPVAVECADWARGSRGALIWGLPIAALLIGGFLPERYLVVLWPSALTFMGVACLLNARRCGRVHCYVTGPFFLILAGVALLHGLRVLWPGKEGWNILGLILLVGGIVLTFGTERVFGRYRRT